MGRVVRGMGATGSGVSPAIFAGVGFAIGRCDAALDVLWRAEGGFGVVLTVRSTCVSGTLT